MSVSHCCFAGCTPLACGCCANAGFHERDCSDNPLTQLNSLHRSAGNRKVLRAILAADGPMPLSDVHDRLAGAFGGDEARAREAVQDALYRGEVDLSADRILATTRRDST